MSKVPLTDKQSSRHAWFMQLVWRPPYPRTSFQGRVVIVTGANVGLGRNAAAHFARLGAARVICASRSLARGEAAVAEIEAELGDEYRGVCEVWQLDLSSYESTRAFAARAAAELPRLDHAVLNASKATAKWELAEGLESSITVNVTSTYLLALLLLPTLRKTSAHGSALPNAPRPPTLTIVSSSAATYATFPERNTPEGESIFDALNNRDTALFAERYPLTKLLQQYSGREMAKRMPLGSDKHPDVIFNMVSPGFNKTSLSREASGLRWVMFQMMFMIFGWEAEEGSRNLLHATVAGPYSHGVHLSECQIWNDSLGSNVTDKGMDKVQSRVWEELVARLERIEPGVTKVLS